MPRTPHGRKRPSRHGNHEAGANTRSLPKPQGSRRRRGRDDGDGAVHGTAHIANSNSRPRSSARALTRVTVRAFGDAQCWERFQVGEGRRSQLDRFAACRRRASQTRRDSECRHELRLPSISQNDPNSDSRAIAAFRVPDLDVRLELRRNGCPVAVTSVLRRSGHGQGRTARRPPFDENPV